MRRWEFNF